MDWTDARQRANHPGDGVEGISMLGEVVNADFVDGMLSAHKMGFVWSRKVAP